MNKLAENIKMLRYEHRWTQEELADKIGVVKATISKYEKGFNTSMKQSVLKKLADIFDVSPAFLMGFTDENTKTGYELSELDTILLDAIHNLEPLNKIKVYNFMKDKGLIK